MSSRAACEVTGTAQHKAVAVVAFTQAHSCCRRKSSRSDCLSTRGRSQLANGAAALHLGVTLACPHRGCAPAHARRLHHPRV
eukprot:6175954-Pleurochrysis_carterae.AAC.4